MNLGQQYEEQMIVCLPARRAVSNLSAADGVVIGRAVWTT